MQPWYSWLFAIYFIISAYFCAKVIRCFMEGIKTIWQRQSGKKAEELSAKCWKCGVSARVILHTAGFTPQPTPSQLWTACLCFCVSIYFVSAYRRCEKPCSTERHAEMPRATKRCVKQTDGHGEEPRAESRCAQSLSILDMLNLSTTKEWQAMGSTEVSKLSCTEDPYL